MKMRYNFCHLHRSWHCNHLPMSRFINVTLDIPEIEPGITEEPGGMVFDNPNMVDPSFAVLELLDIEFEKLRDRIKELEEENARLKEAVEPEMTCVKRTLSPRARKALTCKVDKIK